MTAIAIVTETEEDIDGMDEWTGMGNSRAERAAEAHWCCVASVWEHGAHRNEALLPGSCLLYVSYQTATPTVTFFCLRVWHYAKGPGGGGGGGGLMC